MARPRTINNIRVLENKIRGYFNECNEHNWIPNKAGLCLALGIRRDTYNRYKALDLFSDTLARTELRIENEWLQRLTKNAPMGIIFYLKNAFKEDYKDRTETDITSLGKALPAPILGGITKQPELVNKSVI